MTRVTILLPTRNRADTLAFALQTLLRIDDDRLEILVSDNAGEDGTRDVVLGQSDARLRYINPGRRLAMSQHWEFALAHATGDWLGMDPSCYLKDEEIFAAPPVAPLEETPVLV